MKCEQVYLGQLGWRNSYNWLETNNLSLEPASTVTVAVRLVIPFKGGESQCIQLLTLVAHAQRGLQYLVCVSICLSVCMFVCLRLFSHYRLRGGL